MHNQTCPIATIRALKKQKSYTEALQLCRQHHEYCMQSAQVQFYQNEYGWVIYYNLKEALTGIENKNYRDQQLTYRKIEAIFKPYFDLRLLIKPDLINSVMLSLFTKLHAWEHLLPTLAWFMQQNIWQKTDKEPYKTANGGQIEPLYNRIHLTIAKALNIAHMHNLNPRHAEWAYDQVLSFLKEQPDNLWVNHQLVKYYLQQHQADKALSHIEPLLKAKDKQFWVWSLLGEIYESIDPQQAIANYYHSISLNKDEGFIQNVRLSLAQLLASQQAYEAATYQINQVIKTKQERDYKFKDDLIALINQPWYQELKHRDDLPQDQNYTAQARQLKSILDSRPIISKLGYIDHHNKEKSLSYILFADGSASGILHQKIPAIKELPVNQIVEVDFKEGDQFPFAARATLATEIPSFLLEFTGKIEHIDDKNFAFLITSSKKRIFLPPNLYEQTRHLDTNNSITVKAANNRDKHGKTRWKALEIINTGGLPTHHIVLMAAAPMVTIGPLIDPQIAAKSATLVCSKEQTNIAQQIVKTLKAYKVHATISIVDDPFDKEFLLDYFEKLKNKENKAACINITGGTKMMSLVCPTVFSDARYQPYYVEFSDHITWLTSSEPKHPISDTISLKGYLNSHGYQITGNSAHPLPEDSLSWIKLMLEKDLHLKLSSIQPEIQSTSENKLNGLKLSLNQAQTEDLAELIQLLIYAKLLYLKDDDYYLTSEHAKQLLLGEWLEQWTYAQLKQLQKQDPQLQDIQLGTKIEDFSLIEDEQHNALQNTKNELDVCYLYNNYFNIIECKSGKSFPDNEAQDTINKLVNLKQRIGGVKSDAILISLFPLSAYRHNYAKTSSIPVFSGKDEILNIATLLADRFR